MRSRRLLATVFVVASLTAGCSPGSGEEVQTEPAASAAPTEEAAVEPATITISDFAFVVPDSVAPGTVITVTNEDESFHTVTADDGAFDVGARKGEPVTFTAPMEPGEYTFHCGPHPEMVATLVVG